MRLFFVTLMVALISAFSNANASSDWLSGLGYKARLIEGSSQADGTFQAAFEIILEKGWSTYWRVPGEHGIPPLFEYAESSNIKDLIVHWPAPDVFVSGTGLTIGYKNRVVLPFTIIPEENAQKAELNLSAFFGVCSEICVPADANVSVLLDPKNTKAIDQPIIDEAMLTVPTKHAENGLDVTEVSLKSNDEDEYVYVRLQLPDSVNNVSVLTEGPQDWYFEPYVSKLSNKEANSKSYMAKVPLYRLVRTALSGEEQLNVTVIVDGTAIEKAISLNNL
ncbi:MAG: protein-disulfide reductase DsbD domain-containing protein [Hyphomicrobiales bacterium]